MPKLFFVLIYFITVNISLGQFNESEFLFRAKTIYYSLRLSGLNNFSAWVTSNNFIEKTKEIYDQELYPLEIIWKNPNQIFYIKRPIPILNDDDKQKAVHQLQMDLLQELRGLLIDWQRFYAGNVLDDLPETYLVTLDQDTAFVQFEKYEDGKNMKVKMVFGVNGICIKIITSFPETKEEILVYPGYTMVENKWLANKWTVQILKNGQVESGFVVRLESSKIDNYWIPKKLIMQLKKKGLENTWFIREYTLTNIVLNKDLQILR